MDQSRLSRTQLLAYSAPLVPIWVLHAPALSVIPALYSKHTSVSVALVGIILTATRLLDAFTDPLIGYFSDRTRSPLGQRKPWIIVGGLIAAVSVYFWFRPSLESGAWYFLLSSVGIYIGWTLVEIPHSAWLSELTDDYDERSRISAYRTAASYLGWMMFIGAPLLPIFATTEMTPEVTAFVSWFVIGLIPVTVFLAVRHVPHGKFASTYEINESTTAISVKDTFRDLYNNVPLRFLSATAFLGFFAGGMVGALYFFFLDAYLGILDKIAHIGLIVTGVSVVTTPLWPFVIGRIGKHFALAIVQSATALTLVGMAFIRPGDFAFPMLATLFGISALLSTGGTVCLLSLMADVVDYDEWKTGRKKAANYFALTAVFQKMGHALGGGIAFIIVGIFGFDPQGDNNNIAMAGFFLTFLAIPFVLNATAAAIAARFPIDRRRQQIIRQRLDRRCLSTQSQTLKS